MKSLLAIAAIAFVALPAAPNCTVSFTAPAQVSSGSIYDVEVNAANGAYNYLVTESWGAPVLCPACDVVRQARVNPVQMVDRAGPFELHSFMHRTTDDMPVTYYVTAWSTSNPADACTASTTVLVKGDPELKRMTARGVIPIVGSVDGANGSRFRTELKLSGSPNGLARLVFHPAGQPGRDSDPSIPITLDGTGHLILSDLMAQFGFAGLGSLDVVPNAPDVIPPAAEARIYNLAPNGTYGTLEPMVSPADWFGLSEGTQGHYPIDMSVPPLTGGFRLNIGVRSFTDVVMWATVMHADGSRERSGLVSIGADEVVMGSPEQIFGLHVAPGDSITVLIDRGYGVPFYTVTDNNTNDSALSIPQNRNSAFASHYSD